MDYFGPETVPQPFERARQSTVAGKKIAEELDLDITAERERDIARHA